MRLAGHSRRYLLWFLVLLQIAFFFSNFFYALHLKGELETYLSETRSLGSSINRLQGLALNTTEELMQVSDVVLPLEQATREMTLLAFYLTPFILWLLWTIFQGTSWYLLRKESISNGKRFFVHYAIISAVIISAYLIAVYQLLLTELVYVGSVTLSILALSFLAYLLLSVYSLSIHGKSFFEDLKSFLKLRFLRVILLVFAMFVVSLTSFFFFIVLLLSSIEHEYFFLNLPLIIALVCFLSAINVLLKMTLAKKSNMRK